MSPKEIIGQIESQAARREEEARKAAEPFITPLQEENAKLLEELKAKDGVIAKLTEDLKAATEALEAAKAEQKPATVKAAGGKKR